MVTKRMWLTWKEKRKVLEELDKGGSLKACVRKHNIAHKKLIFKLRT
jgi:hypothetical protein